jgi:hypothetical protein
MARLRHMIKKERGLCLSLYMVNYFMEIKEGTQIIFKGQWWIVEKIIENEVAVIVDQEGDEQVIFINQIDTILPSFS